MKTGGYQIIDLKDVNHTTGVGMVHEGIYDKVEGTRKVIMLSGITIDDIEYKDTFVELQVNGSNFEGTIYGKKIVIVDTDVVTIGEVEVDEDEDEIQNETGLN